MNAFGPAACGCSFIQAAAEIVAVANRIAESANNNPRTDQLSTFIDVVDDVEKLLVKIGGLEADMPTMARVVGVSEHLGHRWLKHCLEEARITCQKIKNIREEAGRRGGFSCPYSQASVKSDEQGPNYPTTVPAATDRIPMPTENEVGSSTPEHQLREGDHHTNAAHAACFEHGSELEMLVVQLEVLVQRLLDALVEDASKSTGSQDNLTTLETRTEAARAKFKSMVRLMSGQTPSHCRGRGYGYDESGRNEKNEMHRSEHLFNGDKRSFTVDVRDNGHVIRPVRLEEFHRQTDWWKLQVPALPKVSQEAPSLHPNGLFDSRRNNKEQRSKVAAVVMTAAVIGAIEMSVWDVFRRDNRAIQSILDPVVGTAEPSPWDTPGRQNGAIPSILYTFGQGSCQSFQFPSHPVVLISGAVLNITALTIYYHLQSGRGRSAVRDLALIAFLSLAVSVGALLSFDAISLLVMVAPWAAIMVLIGTA
ncbi:hypothetical protein B0T16DRAFT_444380 [Cercophora newfieldiana]|uniref:Uncharacterized protein n=1 Tax=Cercophora newfieldiana TaxID=92897 RepID=A0AA40CR24_9PEZI|nr:hypothetical protein B0T16DRAFT_444380 [Cercophora newfieldiana]